MTFVVASEAPGSPSSEDLPAVDVEVAFTSRPADPPSWRSIATGIVTSLGSDRGRDGEFDDPRTGTCTVVVNNRNSWLTPWNTNSPWYGLIRPGLRIRLIARWSGVPYQLFEGYLDGFPQTYGEGLDATVTLTAGDTFKRLADIDLPASLYEMVVSTYQPAHWWRLDEEDGIAAHDNGGSVTSLHGEYRFDVTQGADGIVAYDGGRKAASFAHVSKNQVKLLSGIPITTYPFTIEAWIECVSAPAEYRYLLWQGIAGFGGYIELALSYGAIGTSDHLLLKIDDGGGNRRYTQSSNVVADGLPHHVVVVVASASSHVIIIDGVNVTSAVSTAGTGAPGITIGQSVAAFGGTDPGNGTGLFGLNGSMANIAIYDYPLTVAQALDHYNAGAQALAGETTGARVTRVLDYCQVPTVDRDIDPGDSTLGAHTVGGSALSYIQKLATTEQGRCYVSAANKVTLRARHNLIVSATTMGTPFILDDRAVTGPAYEDVSIPFGDDQIRNPVTVTRDGGAPQTWVDEDAQERNGLHTYRPSGFLFETDNQSFDAAAYFVSRYKDAFARVDKIVLRPQFFPAYWATFLALEQGTPIRLIRRAPGSASTLTLDTAIEGVKHDYDRGAGWTITLALSPRDLTTYWILGDTTYSVLGFTTRLGF